MLESHGHLATARSFKIGIFILVIKDNKFFIKKLKTIIFLGQSENFKELLKINQKLGIKTIIITSEHQAKLINKKEINYLIFNKLDENFNKFINKKTNINETLFISLGARYIFKKNTINKFFKNHLVNFHGTRLPLDAGGGNCSWKIMREDRIDNQLCHLIDEGVDTGPILFNKTSLVPKNCSIPIDFENYILKKFLEFYKEFLKKLINNYEFELKPQINYLGRYNPRLNAEKDGLIDWSLDSYDLINFINAFDDPFKGASTYLNNGNFGKLFLKKTHLHGGDSSNHPYMSGIVSRHDKDWIVVSTSSKHMLLIERVLDVKGRNILEKIKVGDRFFTPHNELELSKKNKTVYNSKGLKKN
jgi:methionyl-tRNA formyltransferase